MQTRRKDKLRLAILISGSGTNLQALIDRAKTDGLAAEIVVVASDRVGAYGLVRARQSGIPDYVIDYSKYLKLKQEDLARKAFPVDLDALDRTQKILRHPDKTKRILQLARLVLAEQELIGELERYRPDLICLAGYMRLVTPYFLSHYNAAAQMRVLNIHPALLPAFPGQHGYEDTFSYGCKWGGITVHFVDEGEDTGPIIAQAVYPIWPEDDLEKVRKRGLKLEYEVYAQCINWLAAGRVKVFRSLEGRLKIQVQDPSYQTIMKNWLLKAMS